MTLHSAPPSVSRSVSSLMSLREATQDNDFLNYDDYWMAVASLASQRSRDPKRKVDYVIYLNINLISDVSLSTVNMFDLFKGHPTTNPTSI